MSAIASVKSTAHKAAFSPLMEILARLGYGVRGVIYLVMGLLAVQVALGKGGALASPQGAIAAIGKQPVGLIINIPLRGGLLTDLNGFKVIGFGGFFVAFTERHLAGIFIKNGQFSQCIILGGEYQGIV